jgi:hypothetical protein
VEQRDKKARKFAGGAVKVISATFVGLAGFVVSPEHIFNKQAPIPLAFTV